MNETNGGKAYPRDVLLHILSVITLYWSAGSMLTLLFAYVNIWVPDPLETYARAGGAINWPLAMLFVLFPVYLWSVWFLNRDLAHNPEKREYKIRRWLLYLNVFLAAALLIGDAVALIYGFLSGGLSARFSLKVLAVFAVGAAVFAYYLFDLRREPTDRAKLRWWRYGSIFAVVAVISAGIFLAGSPFRQRLILFDQRKVSDLQSIQWQIVNYWQNKGRLPAKLDDLSDNISGFAVPQDPQGDGAYTYRATGSLSFELCAKFNLPSEAGEASRVGMPAAKGLEGENWQHGAGEECFSRTIDPELYRLNKSVPATVNSFSSCAAAGYPIQESYPRQCRVSSSKVFVERQGDAVCVQVITAAENPKTGESGTFPTPCDVPVGWVASTPAQFCGGIAGIACPAGYECRLEGDYPDAGGTCVETTR